MFIFKRNERGDTMIEVMFAMAIISVVLAAAYATSSKNLQTSQLSKERTIATNIAETQLEQLKALKEVPSEDVFCLDLSSSSSSVTATDPANPSTECVEDFYEKSITKDSNNSTFTIRVEWVPPGGSEDNKAIVLLQYRDYDFSTLGSSTVTSRVISSTGSSATINVEINNQTSVVERGIVYGSTRNLAVDTTGFTTKRSTSTNDSFTIIADGLSPDTRYYLRAFIRLSDGSFRFSNLIEINSGPATVAVSGDGYILGSCIANPAYPCNNVGGGVFSNDNFRADYPFSIPSNSGYNSIVIDYSDNAGYPNPPTDWYNYSINIYVNGRLSISNYLIGASSGRVVLPFDNSVALSSIGIQWTNNYWVSTNTVFTAYDPDFWIRSVGVAAVDASEFTSVKPAVSTGSSSSVTRTSAVVSGTVVSEGDGSITERGIVYGPYINPSIGNNNAISTQTTGAFSATLTDLKPNTTYYARAYARSSAGYSYAPTYISFTTIPVGNGYEYRGEFGGSHYYLSDARVRWSTANTRAENLGGHLVTITSQAENNFVSSIALPYSAGGNWIGLEDLDNDNVWRWVTGEPVSFINWARGGVCGNQPEKNPYFTGGARQLVAEINMGLADVPAYSTCESYWNDEDTTFSNRFIVEFD